MWLEIVCVGDILVRVHGEGYFFEKAEDSLPGFLLVIK